MDIQPAGTNTHARRGIILAVYLAAAMPLSGCGGGGGNNSNIDFYRLRTAQAFKLAGLYYLEQLGLQFQRQFANLIQKQSPAFGSLKDTRFVSDGARERAFFVPEQLVFDQVWGKCCTIDNHKRFGTALTQLVNAVSDDALAGSCFSEQKYRCRSGSHLPGRTEYRLELLALSDDMLEPLFRYEFLTQIVVLLLDLLLQQLDFFIVALQVLFELFALTDINGYTKHACRRTVPMEIEAFVHGAMCISYSGRCLLSSFMENRDANRGMCCHPCRFSYTVMEAKRPGQYYPLAEDQRGTYIFNSQDLCMIEHLPAMVAAGITSLKIEGRMKGINYLASVVKVYRTAIDALLSDPDNYTVEPYWVDELNRVATRGYGTGFYLGDVDNTRPNYAGNRPGDNRFIAKVVESLNANQVRVQVRNKLFNGDDVEIITPGKPNLKDRIQAIQDAKNQSAEFAQPGSLVTLTFNRSYMPHDLIRKVTT